VTVDPSSFLPRKAGTEPRGRADKAQAIADGELMRRIVEGDESAFAGFYQRFAPALFGMIFQIVQNQKEAEDVLQDAFLQMWKKASSYDSARSSIFTWAVMISRSKAIDRIRSLQRRSRTADAVTAEMSPAPALIDEQASDAVRKHEDRDLVQAALAYLPELQREAIKLAFFSGLTQLEISATIGAPLGTVKARIRRGLLGLKEILRIGK
jgi:RNA polymerase sigma-70 factor (ECF subfamily)